MRFYSSTSSRNLPTDRNPTTIAVGGGGTGTNGATTTEATYTVPALRRFVGMATMTGEVTTVLAAGQSASIIVNVFPSGGATTPIAAQQTEVAAPVGRQLSLPAIPVQLKTGDQVTVVLSIGLGAGVLRADGGIHGVEYDT